jgi:transcriptional regulator with XRE-family HTH domain
MKLYEAREKKKINMNQLSKLSGVAYSHIWLIENENRIPSITVLCKLAVALEIEPQELFEYKNNS